MRPDPMWKKFPAQLDIPDGTKKIRRKEFAGVCFSSVVIPRGCKTIMSMAFFECEYLEKVVIPESCEVIGTWAFHSCYKLKAVLVPKNCEVGKEAFPETCKVFRDINEYRKYLISKRTVEIEIAGMTTQKEGAK